MEVKEIISSGLLELYVTGLTTEEETVQVEEWAAKYDEIRDEILELQNVLEKYAMAEAIQPDEELKEKILSKIKPDASLKDKIFSRIENNETTENNNEVVPVAESKVISLTRNYKWLAAASVILLVGSIIIAFTFYNKYQSTSKDLEIANAELQKQKQIADEVKNDMGVVTDKNAIPVVLNGTDKSPDALAKIFWMKNTGEVYIDPRNLPEAPSGMQYQLWAIVDGKPVDAGMITTDKGTFRIQKMKSFGKADAFAITLETAGGNPTPKGDMIVQAKI